MQDKAIVIGGSAGSFKIVVDILEKIPRNFGIPVILCLHRLKHIRSGFAEALSLRSAIRVIEPTDKESIKAGKIYLAPANYHLLIGMDGKFRLSVDEALNHSRPSIDFLFSTASEYYGTGLTGVLLSGANRDGAAGMKEIFDNGGITVIQNPEESQVNTMPAACLDLFKPHFILDSTDISSFILRQKT